ncbi:MAG: hypothetical protein HW387_494 [Parachlamydiales bacterium]|nr:hypothetical protein [Parachlamydiales bacterium]
MSYFGVPVIRNIVNISQVMAKYARQWTFSSVTVPISLEAYFSPCQTLPHQSNADFSALRHQATNRYIYSIFTLSPLFNLPHNFELFLNLRTQLSSQNLISTEQFGLGGFYSVRGYDENEIYRDNAILTNIELRLPSFNFIKRLKNRLQFLLFLDTGMGWDVHPAPNVKNLQYLIGTGPGLRYNLSNYLVFRFDCGFKLHRTEFDQNENVQKIHFGLVGSF